MILEANKTVKLFGKSFAIEYPNVGQNIDIAKAQAYYKPDFSSDREVMLKDLHDALSFFRIMAKDFEKDLNYVNAAELPMSKAKEILSVYKKEVEPWVFEWEDEFASIYKDLSDARNEQAKAEAALNESVENTDTDL